MEVFLTSIFSAIIIMITVISMNRVFYIALQRREVSRRKYLVLASSSVVVGFLIASILPFAYEHIFQTVNNI